MEHPEKVPEHLIAQIFECECHGHNEIDFRVHLRSQQGKIGNIILFTEVLHFLTDYAHCCKSVDTVFGQPEVINYPTVFLNSLKSVEVPTYCFSLKLGTSTMILGNFDLRLTVNIFMLHDIDATNLSGSGLEKYLFIPRIPFIHPDIPFDV